MFSPTDGNLVDTYLHYDGVGDTYSSTGDYKGYMKY